MLREVSKLRLLVGPAGSGKTYRCVSELQSLLKSAPCGPPLILIVPRQATFQAERAILSDPELAGYTRLWVCSFERLAELILKQKVRELAPLADEPCRAMLVYKALRRLVDRFSIFRADPPSPGLITEISQLLEKLESHSVGAERLHHLARSTRLDGRLRNKLKDLALILEEVGKLCREAHLRLPEKLLSEAAALLLQGGKGVGLEILFEGVWVDGFVELTPQQLLLLKAVAKRSRLTTIALCVDLDVALRASDHGLAIWDLPLKALSQVHELAQELGVHVEVIRLPEAGQPTRFRTPSLGHLERVAAGADAETAHRGDGIQLLCFPTQMEEVVWVAREVRRLVAEEGFRYRDVIVVLRKLDTYINLIQRIFTRYEIPYFVDTRRQIVGHPIVRATIAALEVLAAGWNSEAIIKFLRSGLSSLSEGEIDRLELVAIQRGWDENDWCCPTVAETDDKELDRLRRQAIRPLIFFEQQLLRLAQTEARGKDIQLDGVSLTKAIRKFWGELDIQKQLQWDRHASSVHWFERMRGWLMDPQVQPIVMNRLEAWLKSLALIYAEDKLSLADWRQLIEMSLQQVTVGLIPLSLDQVLIGSVDRSRNPPARVAFVLGWNDGLFPWAGAEEHVFSENERAVLSELLGEGFAQTAEVRIKREHYLAYMALTRASEKLYVSWCRTDVLGRSMSVSPYLYWLERSARTLKVSEPEVLTEIEHNPVHRHELHRSDCYSVRQPKVDTINMPPPAADPAEIGRLTAETLEQIFGGRTLFVSASGLETYAACPFRFFVEQILRIEKPKPLELDPTRRGRFLHLLLERFHRFVRSEAGGWCGLNLEDACKRLEALAYELAQSFEWGLFCRRPLLQIQMRQETELLKRLVQVMHSWHEEGYQFEPELEEWSFELSWPSDHTGGGFGQDVDTSSGRWNVRVCGKIDRVDILRHGDESWAVILDFKTAGERLDPVMIREGLQIQLPLYAKCLEMAYSGYHEKGSHTAKKRLKVMGLFFVPIKPQLYTAKDLGSSALHKIYRPAGRYVYDAAEYLGPLTGSGRGTQLVPMTMADYQKWLDDVVATTNRFVEKILSGQVEPSPYVYKRSTACDSCPWPGICRIDRQGFRYREINQSSHSLQPFSSQWSKAN